MVVGQPPCAARVQDKPSISQRRETGVHSFKTNFLNIARKIRDVDQYGRSSYLARSRSRFQLQRPDHRDLPKAPIEGGLANRDNDRKRARARPRFEPLPGGPQATRRALAKVGDARGIVLVEGISDQIAVETLAARRGRNLDRESVSVVPIGGAQAIGRFLTRFGPQGSDARLAGLYDAGEEEVVRRSLERAGFGSHLTRFDLERLGFHVCVADLEDELIRALGPASVEAVLGSEGDLGSFRTFQKQPAWRGQSIEAQLRRFMGSADRRKIRYARLLVDALDLAQVPRPLDRVLAHV